MRCGTRLQSPGGGVGRQRAENGFISREVGCREAEMSRRLGAHVCMVARRPRGQERGVLGSSPAQLGV